MIAALLDTDDNPIYDRSALLVAKGDPASAGDFVLIDDESGTFSPNGNLVVLERDSRSSDGTAIVGRHSGPSTVSGPVMLVRDSVDDAPALAAADVGAR